MSICNKGNSINNIHNKTEDVKQEMGRKQKLIKRASRVTVRFTEKELWQIQRFSKLAGFRVAYFIRYRSLDFEIKPRLTSDEVDLYRKLTGMANNLNQLTKSVHSGEIRESELKWSLQMIASIIEKLQ